MSTWTHVCGVIRFDGLSILGESHEPDCGNTCSFEDDSEAWDKCNVPCGSEGSIQISKWTNPCSSSMARWTYSIFGDLRDYENDQEIIDYFNRIVDGKYVRQGCYSFEVEGSLKRIFTYDENTKMFVESKS